MSQTVLSPCPDKPNCVCSFENPKNDTNYIAPVKVKENPLATIESHLAKSQGFKLVKKENNYLKYEFTSSFFKFVDDVEFLFSSADGFLHFRSASRVGYSDLGANRKRIITLLKELNLK